jgi:murein DD-endopeptidase MepM/ murein hydrolase activator NlpD
LQLRQRHFSILVVVIAVALLAAAVHARRAAEATFTREAELARQDLPELAARRTVLTESAVEPGQNFSDVLADMGLDGATAYRMVEAAQPAFSLRQIRPGHRVTLGRSGAGALRFVRYQIDPEHILWIVARDKDFQARVETITTTTEVAGVSGKVNGSLWQAVLDAGETPELAMRLAAIFGWDLDFYTDTRPGDTFRLALEKKRFSNGQTAGYGRILAAEYVNGAKPYRAVLFHDTEGKPAYYKDDGASLQKAFLRSPLKYAAPVTSHFSQHRFHPILKMYRAHLGTDYGAPVGTPVQTIGSGRVVFAGRKGGDGILVKVQHANGYQTYYMHLSRALVGVGQHVEQGQLIGRVGATGLATGPHLDFRISLKGRFENFEKLRLQLPPANPVSKKDWPEFAQVRDQELAELPAAQSAQAGIARRAAALAASANGR